MRTRMYGGVRGRKTKVGGKPTFVFLLLDSCHHGVQSTLCDNDVPVVKRLLFPLESLYVPVVVTVTAKVYVLPPPV